MMWAVVMSGPQRPGHLAYGPFTDQDVGLAMQFADFVTDEIDPAIIVRTTRVRPDATWRSPLRELLSWRANAKKRDAYTEAVEQLIAGGLMADLKKAPADDAAEATTESHTPERTES